MKLLVKISSFFMGIVLFDSCSNDVKINGDFSDGGDMNVSL